MTQVTQREGESFDNMLRRFRKKVSNARIMSDVKKNRFFVSKSDKRQIALRKAKRRERKRQWRENHYRS